MSAYAVDPNGLFQTYPSGSVDLPSSVMDVPIPPGCIYDATVVPTLGMYGSTPINLSLEQLVQVWFGVSVWKLNCNSEDVSIDIGDMLSNASNRLPRSSASLGFPVDIYLISGTSADMTTFSMSIQLSSTEEGTVWTDNAEGFFPPLSFSFSDGAGGTATTDSNPFDPSVGTFNWMGQTADIRGTATVGDVNLSILAPWT